MAASLMILTGQPKALRKSNPIQPSLRLWGSRRGHSLMMGPGKPSEIQSNFQSRTDFLTTWTILRGVMAGPDGYFRGSFCPLASILTFVPPRSMTRTLADFAARAAFIAAPSGRDRIDFVVKAADNEFYDDLSAAARPRIPPVRGYGTLTVS